MCVRLNIAQVVQCTRQKGWFVPKLHHVKIEKGKIVSLDQKQIVTVQITKSMIMKIAESVCGVSNALAFIRARR
jgi:hypothetical protein